jgi:hypothetical protein
MLKILRTRTVYPTRVFFTFLLVNPNQNTKFNIPTCVCLCHILVWVRSSCVESSCEGQFTERRLFCVLEHHIRGCISTRMMDRPIWSNVASWRVWRYLEALRVVVLYFEWCGKCFDVHLIHNNDLKR